SPSPWRRTSSCPHTWRSTCFPRCPVRGSSGGIGIPNPRGWSAPTTCAGRGARSPWSSGSPRGSMPGPADKEQRMRRFESVDVSRLILGVQKPSRYLGNEVNAIRKDLRAAEITWALAFPDLYEMGMSNLGFRVLYHVLNRREETAAERTFMPDVDLAEKMKARNIPLFSWESRAPIRDFDLVGFSLQYELC